MRTKREILEQRITDLEIEVEKKNFKKISNDLYRGKVDRFEVSVVQRERKNKLVWIPTLSKYGRVIAGGIDSFSDKDSAIASGIGMALNPEEHGIRF